MHCIHFQRKHHHLREDPTSGFPFSSPINILGRFPGNHSVALSPFYTIASEASFKKMGKNVRVLFSKRGEFW